jgi:putative transposase
MTDKYMRILNPRKIRWILRELQTGELSVYQIAKTQKVSPRWVRELPVKYLGVKPYDISLKKPGRTAAPLKYEEIALIAGIHEEFPMGSTKIEKHLQWKGMQHIPHNRIHAILKVLGKVKQLDKKIRRKKWVRYERRHSNSLWHTDFCEIEGRQLISYIDDASRYIVGYGMFGSATTDNALQVLNESISDYGKPKQVMTDHGTQFCSDEEKVYKYREDLKKLGIKHIMARVKRPQSNGKEERWFGTFKKIYFHFNRDLDKAVVCYNEMIHLSLDTCPSEAYERKKRNS